MIDLLKKYENSEEIHKGIEKLNLLNDHPKFKKGDIISFFAGYDCNMLMKSKITGFDKDGGIYVLWDCYWFPIKNNKERNIKLIQR